MTEPDIDYLLRRLGSDQPRDRANTLRGLTESPIADRRLLGACEALLDDDTITLLSIPYQFGEIRWVAAGAVAALRGALGMTEPVVVRDTFAPCSSTDVARLVREAGLSEDYAGLEGAIGALRELAATARLPRRTLTRRP